MVMVCLRGSGSFFNSGKYVTIGVSTLLINLRSMAMPASSAMMLFDADLMFASRDRDWFGA
jgi:hypothetical protein